MFFPLILFWQLIVNSKCHGLTGSTVTLLTVNREVSLIDGLVSETLENDGRNVSYYSSWLRTTEDHYVACNIRLVTEYPTNITINWLSFSYQVKGHDPVQLWLDYQPDRAVHSRAYVIDLPLIVDIFRIVITLASPSVSISRFSLLQKLEVSTCWSVFQSCPVLVCPSNNHGLSDPLNDLSNLYFNEGSTGCSRSPLLSFNCSNNAGCAHLDQVCDFEKNCLDGSDEQNCDSFEATQGLRCSFEDDYCGWKHAEAGTGRRTCFWGTCAYDQGLKRVRAKKSLLEGPTIDHTQSNENGHYLLLKSSNRQGITMGAVSSDHRISGRCKLVLHYQTNCKSGQILIRSGDNSTSSNPFSTIEVVDLDWEKSLFQRVEIEIDLMGPGEWIFIVSIMKGCNEYSYLAIDDIYLTKGCSSSSSHA